MVSIAKRMRDAIDQKTASVVEHLGRITGYTTGIAFFAHTVAETNPGLMALIGAASEFGGPGFLLPTRNHEVFTWCLTAGLRLVYQDDADDDRSLQRAGRGVPAVCPILTRAGVRPVAFASGSALHRPSSCWFTQTWTVFDSSKRCAALRSRSSATLPTTIATTRSHL